MLRSQRVKINIMREHYCRGPGVTRRVADVDLLPFEARKSADRGAMSPPWTPSPSPGTGARARVPVRNAFWIRMLAQNGTLETDATFTGHPKTKDSAEDPVFPDVRRIGRIGESPGLSYGQRTRIETSAGRPLVRNAVLCS